MMQEAKSAAASRKKLLHRLPAKQPLELDTAALSSNTRPPFSWCSKANTTRRSLRLKSCCPRRLPRSVSAARCTSAHAVSQIDSMELAFHTPEERYDYAISQLNHGRLSKKPRDQLNGILADDPTPTSPSMAWPLLTASPASAGLPGQPLAGHRTQSQKPPAGALRQRLPEHGRRPALHRVAVS